MHRKLIALTTAALALGGVAAPLAGAADDLKVTGAYLYRDHLAASKQNFVRVVFRTAKPLPRRSDGSIQAGASIGGVNHSIGAAKRGTSCYTGATEIKGGAVATIQNGAVVHRGAKLGRTFTVKVTTRDGRSFTKKLALRAERRGDDTGKPLGC